MNIIEDGYIPYFDAGEKLNKGNFDIGRPSSIIFKNVKALAYLKQIQRYHNTSWYKELKNYSNGGKEEIALFYRGNRISFNSMFIEADKLAESLVTYGIKKGDEIPCCLSNTPELVYLLLAANKIGAKLNLFGSNFNKDYLEEILSGCTDKVLFASDDNYSDIQDVVSRFQYKKKVLVSLTDSLLDDPTTSIEYVAELSKYYSFENRSKQFIASDKSLISYNDFISSRNVNVRIIDDNKLDTPFLVTYTSGSTNSGYPKQILHANRSLIVSGWFHRPELSGNPEITGLRGMAHIHPESNTNIITCISDNLMQLWSVAMEPLYDKKTFLDCLMINKPNYVNATTSFWLQMAKDLLAKKEKMPYLFAPFAVGESMSKGEQKLINSALRKCRAGSGIKIKGFSLPFVSISIGGGDCEHGGIYYTLWPNLKEKLYFMQLRGRNYGLEPEKYVQVGAFKKNEDGTYRECAFNELGILAANSATTMMGYKNKLDKTKELIIVDDLGNSFISLSVYGYIDELGCIHIKGRINSKIKIDDSNELYFSDIESIVCRDTKNILSCSVVRNLSNSNRFILNIELQPGKNNKFKVLTSLYKRCKKAFPADVINMLDIRIISDFPLKASGKRDIKALENPNLGSVLPLNNITQLLCSKDGIKSQGKRHVKTR